MEICSIFPSVVCDKKPVITSGEDKKAITTDITTTKH